VKALGSCGAHFLRNLSSQRSSSRSPLIPLCVIGPQRSVS
jgi:hypothetical protein